MSVKIAKNLKYIHDCAGKLASVYDSKVGYGMSMCYNKGYVQRKTSLYG
jgi:hypothetical protein